MPTRLLLFLTLALFIAKVRSEPIKFEVLTYNVFLRAPTWIFHNQHSWRSERIPQYLSGYDVVVLQEAFSKKHREGLLTAMSSEYPYHSRVLGEDEFMSYNGGVIILSRWPILRESQEVFDVCDGSDCMVKKGVIYTAISKPGLTTHVFGLHLQAEKKYSSVRVQQFPQLRSFIDNQQINTSEPLLVMGDFNVDYFSDSSAGEFSELTHAVGLELPNDSMVPSYDDDSNSVIDDPVRERLDYIFYSADHLRPIEAASEVLYFRDGNRDLSDHHPLSGQFSFETNP